MTETEKMYAEMVKQELSATEEFVQAMSCPANMWELSASLLLQGIVTAGCVFTMGAAIDKVKEVKKMKAAGVIQE